MNYGPLATYDLRQVEVNYGRFAKDDLRQVKRTTAARKDDLRQVK